MRPIWLVVFLVSSTGFAQSARYDFGLLAQQNLHDNSARLFGIQAPLLVSETDQSVRVPEQKPGDLILLAKGLTAEFLTRDAGHYADMFVFWPDDEHATHLIFCIEGARQELKPGKWNPSIQRIDIHTGKVDTVVRGMNRCDGIRRTPWGTVLATEETADGQAYELLDPIRMNNVRVINRATGQVSEPDNMARREALPTLAWEGLVVLDNGVVIAGDELRPGHKDRGDQGGAIYKFVPDKAAAKGRISSLAASPLVSGSVFALRVDCLADTHRKFPQSGQGCEVGNATWVRVEANKARADANAAGATGYYRPEDLEQDPLYIGAGMRFCWANTGNKSASNYGEVVCAVDTQPLTANAQQATVRVQRFIAGDQELNSVDNLAFQPLTGNLYVLEDDENGEIYACLPDGRDRDLMSDGCIRILAVRDKSAEPTGFAFSADGKTAYLSIQHSDDALMPLVDDYPTDDILRITGFQLPAGPGDKGE